MEGGDAVTQIGHRSQQRPQDLSMFIGDAPLYSFDDRGELTAPSRLLIGCLGARHLLGCHHCVHEMAQLRQPNHDWPPHLCLELGVFDDSTVRAQALGVDSTTRRVVLGGDRSNLVQLAEIVLEARPRGADEIGPLAKRDAGLGIHELAGTRHYSLDGDRDRSEAGCFRSAVQSQGLHDAGNLTARLEDGAASRSDIISGVSQGVAPCGDRFDGGREHSING